MKFFIITGTSSGIGKALALKLLRNSSYQILGISRSKKIEHDNYNHLHYDLSLEHSDESFKAITDLVPENVDEVILINNAGTISPVSYIGGLPAKAVVESFYLNTINPLLITNAVVRFSLENKTLLSVVNIGTGASSKAIDGWTTYCSTKAALKMMTEVWAQEKKIKKWPFKFIDFVPGVVDTPMQESIRSSASDDFSLKSNFIKYKNDRILESPNDTAVKIIKLLELNF